MEYFNDWIVLDDRAGIDILDGFCRCGCGSKTRVPERTWKSVGYVKGVPLKFVARHKTDLPSAIQCDSNGCWVWQKKTSRAVGVANGYGKIAPKPWSSSGQAHRVFYERLIRKVPDNLHLDYLCRNTLCVNPWHLEPVPAAVNVQRGLLAKLNECQVREIRQRWTLGRDTLNELAEEYDVSANTIGHIVRRVTWKNI